MSAFGRRATPRCVIKSIFIGLPLLWVCLVIVMFFNMTNDKRKQSLRRPQSRTNLAIENIDQRNVNNRTNKEDERQHEDEHSDIHVNFANNKNKAVDDSDDGVQINNDIEDRHFEIRNDGWKKIRNMNDKNDDIKFESAGKRVKQEVRSGDVNGTIPLNELKMLPGFEALNLIFEPQTDMNAPGEMGKGVAIDKQKLPIKERLKYEAGWNANAFNLYASDQISIQRTLPDTREPRCKELMRTNLPDTSIIICFHNEAMSVLLRTIHSVLNRSPSHLIKEIILVDDFSDQDHLKKPLEAYIARLEKVKLVRTDQREGLVRARLAGYAVATGTVLTFLDSHCECTEGWLEPLLGPIDDDRSTVVSPVIDPIMDESLAYVQGGRTGDNIPVGVFDWGLTFHWKSMSKAEKRRRKSTTEPVRTPTMAGGLFSVHRAYFTSIGTYDSGMDIWGGENVELSFRVWMCGGTLTIAPCSHVGHIFRKTSPYNFVPGTNVLRRNSIRLAEVWLDDYKSFFYERFNYDLGNYGDVSERKELRKKLNCHTFEWYLSHIYPEMYIPKNAIATGQIQNKMRKVCLDSPVGRHGFVLKSYGCHGQGGNQFWTLTEYTDIRRDEGCFSSDGSIVEINACHKFGGSQSWKYREDNTIYHVRTEKCLDLPLTNQVKLAKCTGSLTQQWIWTRR